MNLLGGSASGSGGLSRCRRYVVNVDGRAFPRSLAREQALPCWAAFRPFIFTRRRDSSPALCSKLCSSRVGKRQIGTGRDRRTIGRLLAGNCRNRRDSRECGSTLVGLANRRLQPLGHLTVRGFPTDFASSRCRRRPRMGWCARQYAQVDEQRPAGLRRSRHYSDQERCGSCGRSISSPPAPESRPD